MRFWNAHARKCLPTTSGEPCAVCHVCDAFRRLCACAYCLCVLVMVDEVGAYARDRASVCALVGLRTCAPVCVVRWQRCACEPACTMHSVCKSAAYRILSTVRIISTMNCAFRLASTRRAACTRSLRIPSRSAFLRRLVRRA